MSERIVAKVEGKVKLFHFKARKDYGSRDTHSQNRTFRASLLTANKFARNFVLFMNGRPLRPADLSNFYASMKFVQI